MSFRGRRVVRMAVIGLGVAAIGAPASFSQDPYSGEGYGGSMDGGGSVSISVAKEQAVANGSASELDRLIAEKDGQNDAWFAAKAMPTVDPAGN
jgi:hypothetical protein